MKCLGKEVTQAKMNEMMSGLDSDLNTSIDTLEFLNKMSMKIRELDDYKEDIREAFQTFDRDGSGFLCVDKLRKALTSLGEELTEEQANNIINQFDVDGDGRINYEEFLTMMTSD